MSLRELTQKEAAVEIERLRTERDDLMKANALLHALIGNREAEIERLRTALKPFADMATFALRTPGDCAYGTMTVEINRLFFAKGVLEHP
jgi:hypothetical protein